jgi:hypothetical protein
MCCVDYEFPAFGQIRVEHFPLPMSCETQRGRKLQAQKTVSMQLSQHQSSVFVS